MSSCIRSLILLALSLALVPRIHAAELNSGKKFWVNLSGGNGSMSHYGGGDAVRLALSYEPGSKLFYSLAMSGVTDSAEISPGGKADVTSAAFDILIGKRFIKPGLGFIAASSGISFVASTPRNYKPNDAGQAPDPESTVGLPLNVQMVFSPIKWLGIGLDTFANLNSRRSNVGACFGLYLGKMW